MIESNNSVLLVSVVDQRFAGKEGSTASRAVSACLQRCIPVLDTERRKDMESS
jgi:hypothetical protein